MAKIVRVLIEKDETGYFVISCPTIQGCYTQGKTLNEALDNIKEAIALCLEDANQSKGYSLKELLDQITPENLHGEISF